MNTELELKQTKIIIMDILFIEEINTNYIELFNSCDDISKYNFGASKVKYQFILELFICLSLNYLIYMHFN